ncbi:MAG: response regulator transcription factor [Cyclobacteriaceae bacterium]|nr:response regulator transcription factor [Cyclobacteriaceae bacterium]
MKFSWSIRRKEIQKHMKTILIDDHTILLDGIRALLERDGEHDILATATNAEEGLDLLRQHKPDLLITDFNLPGMDGLSLIRRVKQLLPDMKIVVLSMHDETHLVKEILKEGVNAYLLKKDSHKELLEALRQVQDGKVFLSDEINKMLIRSLNNPDENRLLTDREREILKLIAKEYSNKQIAEELFISERTVETHRKNIFRKTGTNSLVGLIKFAYSNNLI